jgi:hypothetical protein
MVQDEGRMANAQLRNRRVPAFADTTGVRVAHLPSTADRPFGQLAKAR